MTEWAWFLKYKDGSTQELIKIIHYLNRTTDRSIGVSQFVQGKVFDKMQHFFHDKNTK